jgi:capsule biosynthesis phosphatase
MSKIYCFDIDDTICKTHGTDYANSQPIKERIIKINKLKKDGNTIIFYTARGFVSKIDYLELTTKQLSNWGVNYDKIYMGKPNADYYIDDKNGDPFGWFLK